MSTNMEHVFQIHQNEDEVTKISQNNQTIWERAVSLESDKDSEVTFRSTRNESKNLFDKNNLPERIDAYFANSGTTWTYVTTGYSLRFPCLPNTTYTARYNGNSTQAVLSFASTSSDTVPTSDQTTVTVTQAIRQNSPTISTPVTLTTGASDKWLIVQYNINDPQNTDMRDNLQIEEGSTATSYQPYWNTLPELNAYGKTEQPSAIKPYVKTAISTTPTTFNSELAGPLNVLADGKTEQRNIPAEYQELESITFPSGAYIKTGIIPKTYDYEVGFKGAFGVTASGPNCAWGFMGASNNLPRWLCATWNDNYLMNANATVAFGTADTNTHTFVGRVYMKNSTPCWSSELDGAIEQNDKTLISTPSWEANTLEIYLGARNNESVTGNYGLITMNHWWCKKADVMIADYIPAKRISDNVIGMYDTVSGQFFTNAGTGTFTAGPVKTPGPNNPMNIVSNNGVIKWDGTKIVTEGIQEKITITSPNGEEQIILVPMLNRVGDYKDYIIYDD